MNKLIRFILSGQFAAGLLGFFAILLTSCRSVPTPAPPSITPLGAVSVEAGKTLVVTANSPGATTYQWTLDGPGSIPSVATVGTIRYTAPDNMGESVAILSVVASNPAGSSPAVTLTINILPLPPTDTLTPTYTLTPTTTSTPTDTPTPTGTPTLTPLPIWSFQDFEKDNGTPGLYFLDVFFMPCSFSDSEVHEGRQDIRCQAQARQRGKANDSGGTVAINTSSKTPLDLSSAGSFFVWVYDVQGGNTVQLVIWDSDGHRSNEMWSDRMNPTVQGKWTEITWELMNSRGESQVQEVDLRQVQYIELYVRNDGEYYFDTVSYK